VSNIQKAFYPIPAVGREVCSLLRLAGDIKTCWICYGACSQCSAPKHLTFNPTFPRKQKLFFREAKDLVILPLLQENCKDKMKGLLCEIVSLGPFIFQNIPLFGQKKNEFSLTI